MRKQLILGSFLLSLALLSWLFWPTLPPAPPLIELTGRTMGTTYAIRYAGPAGRQARDQAGVDSVLLSVNQSLSTYIPTSTISRINASTDVGVPLPIDVHFRTVYLASTAVYQDTDGAFNPAVGPLVEAWGFGPERRQTMSQARVDSLRALVRFEAFQLTADSLHLTKSVAGAHLDFSAIAKGYGVDEVGRYLKASGIEAYFVEIGGEVVVRGAHPAGRPWRVGIDRPIEDAVERQLQAVIELERGGLATSGNYRNFYWLDGQKFAHTIDPATGYPARNSLLSVSILAADCMTADAYATAAMVMG
ncbi:MAG: FAD:protein FMN transferase, partial [Rhodothermales bacterium]|nr:FAD:protein FMN transferase [Rhodothermales bacterium]